MNVVKKEWSSRKKESKELHEDTSALALAEEILHTSSTGALPTAVVDVLSVGFLLLSFSLSFIISHLLCLSLSLCL